MIDMAPSTALCFREDKSGIMLLVALCRPPSLYLPKIVYFYKCVRLLQAKNVSWPRVI